MPGRSQRHLRERDNVDSAGAAFFPAKHAGAAVNGNTPRQHHSAPLTVAADLAAKTITVKGGPADKAYTLTATYQVDGNGKDVSDTISIAEHDTAAAVGNAIKRAVVAHGDLDGSSTSGVVTFSLDNATSLDALTATVA